MKNNYHIIVLLVILYSPILFDLINFFRKASLGQIPKKRVRRYLVRLFAILFVSAGIVLSLNRVNYLNYESPIPFSRYDEIDFQNFRGLEFFRKSLHGNPRFAYVYTSIATDIEDDVVYVESFFHPSRSYVYNRNSYSKELLRHELYHFRITELYGRRIRKNLSLVSNNDRDKIESIIVNLKREERVYQLRYDSDSYHSYVSKEQKKYEHEIDSLISSLHDYSSTKITIPHAQ